MKEILAKFKTGLVMFVKRLMFGELVQELESYEVYNKEKVYAGRTDTK